MAEHIKSFRMFLRESAQRTFTSADAKRLGDELGVNWNKIDLEQLRLGLEVEGEHDDGSELDVVNSDLDLAKIALAHLHELPDYYTRIKAMEEDAPANSVAGGGVAGLTEPVIRKIAPVLKRKRD